MRSWPRTRLPTDENPTLLRRYLAVALLLWTAGLWLSLAAGLALGRGRLNVVTNTPFGEDLLSLHAAGSLVRTGRAPLLYDDTTGAATQAAILGPVGRIVYNRYMSPPHTAALFAAASAAPFAVVAWCWAALGLAAFFATPFLLGAWRPLRAAAVALGFVPVFEGFAAGQNALFTLFLFALGFWLWRRGRGGWAGLVLGLVAIYKPHLLAGVGLLFLLDARRDPWPLLGLLLPPAALASIDLLFFPAETRQFLSWGTAVVAGGASLRPGGELTLTGFFEVLLPHAAPTAHHAAWTCEGVALAVFVAARARIRRRAPGASPPERARDERLLFAAATVLGLWLTPHAHVYEWTLLVLPAVILWTDHPRQRSPLALVIGAVALVAAIGVPLARLQIDTFGIAVHPAGPALLLASVAVLRLVHHQPLWPRAARSRTPA